MLFAIPLNKEIRPQHLTNAEGQLKALSIQEMEILVAGEDCREFKRVAMKVLRNHTVSFAFPFIPIRTIFFMRWLLSLFLLVSQIKSTRSYFKISTEFSTLSCNQSLDLSDERSR